MPAVNAQKLALIILFSLFLILGALASFYWLIFRGSSVGFVSTSLKYKWEIDRESFRQLESIYRENGLSGLILIEFASGFKFIEDYATGWDPDEGYVFTSEWKTRFGIPTLTIYMNEENFAKVPEDGKSLMMTLLVAQRIGRSLNLSEPDNDSITSFVAAEGKSVPLRLGNRFFQK